MRLLLSLPLLVINLGIGALAMLGPAIFAATTRDWDSARVFLYAAILVFFAFLLLALATRGNRRQNPARRQLTALLGTYTLIPLVLAVPVVELVDGFGWGAAWFEMISSLTTTGASLIAPDGAADAVHLWRGQVAWMGGFFMWLAAAAILAPMNLGGFEVTARDPTDPNAVKARQIDKAPQAGERVLRVALRLFPIYGGLTLILFLLLMALGQTPFAAVMLAMATLSTSGIVASTHAGSVSFSAEALVFVFLIFALSRTTFSGDLRLSETAQFRRDPELRLGVAIILLVSAAIFAKHFVGAARFDEPDTLWAALAALWGSLFMVASFLTTTGIESADWSLARYWSGLKTPGLILMGLAVLGGGVATTAGGVKLMRVFALYSHGLRELEKLVHPSSVGGGLRVARHIRRQGAYIAWIFFMLFALSIAAVMAALALTGVGFEEATILTVAALSTTGPLAAVAGDQPILYAEVSAAGQALLAAAMVLGRLETLAIIALFNPDFWRN